MFYNILIQKNASFFLFCCKSVRMFATGKVTKGNLPLPYKPH